MICWLALALLSAPPVARGFTLEMTGPGTPYAQVTYEIAPQRGVIVASISKVFTADFGHREEVSVLDEGALKQITAILDALGACQLPDARREAARRAYRLRCSASGGFQVDDPAQQVDPRYAQAISRLRGFIERRVPPIHFRDPLLRPGEFGWLRVEATPTARVYIDGIALEGETPLAAPLPVGARVIELEPAQGGARQRYEVRVEEGRTTSLVIELG